MEKFLIAIFIFEIIAFAFVLILFLKTIIDEIKPSIIYIINKRKRNKENKAKIIELQEQHYRTCYALQVGLDMEVDEEIINNLFAQLDILEDEIKRRKEL